MTPELIPSIFTGLSGLIAAFGVLMAARSTRSTGNEKTNRRRMRLLEKQTVILIGHVFVLELEIARVGGRVPERPPSLSLLEREDDEEAPSGKS